MSNINSIAIWNTCKVCGQRFPNQHILGQHEKSQHSAPWRCQLCNRIFSMSCELLCHILKHLGLKPWRCDQCGKRFSRLVYLATHKRSHKTLGSTTELGGVVGSLREEPSSFIQISNGQAFERRGWTCRQCDRKFVSYASFQVHRKSHSESFKCDLCGKRLSSLASLNLHYTLHSEEWLYQCDECGKKFPNDSYLEKHSYVHVKEKTHNCDVCNRSFSRPLYLQRHKLRHFLQKPLRCHVCQKEHATESGLRVHLTTKHRLNHDDVKPDDASRRSTRKKLHICELCHKTFSFPSQLKRHAAQHCGLEKRDMKCPTCGQQFRDLHLLKKHLKRRHKQGEIGEAGDERVPVTCQVCGKEYGNRSALRVHQRFKHQPSEPEPKPFTRRRQGRIRCTTRQQK